MRRERAAERSRPGDAAWTRPRRFSAFDGAGLLALLAFAAALVLDRGSLGRPRDEISLELSAEALAAGFREGVEWHGLYREGVKVGFVRLERRRIASGYRLDHTTVLSTPIGSTQVHVRTDLDAGFALTEFVASAQAPIEVRIEGRWVGDALEIRAEGLPGPGTRRLPMAKPPAFDFSLAPLATRSDLQPGDRVAFTHFDPMTLSSAEGFVHMLGRERIEVLGEQVDVLHLRQDIAGQSLELWVNALGEVLREQLPTGIVAVREPEAEATWGLAGPSEAP